MKKINFNKVGKILPFVGIVLFIYIIYDIGIEKIAKAFISIPIYYFVIATLPFFLRILLIAYKWQYISKKQKMDFSLTYLIKIVFISTYYGSITPGGFGWYLRMFYLRKKGNVSLEKCITNTIIDTSTGFIVGSFLGVVGVYLLLAFNPVYIGAFNILLALLIFHVVALLVFIKKSGGGRIANFFLRPLFPKSYKEKFDKSLDSLYEDIPRIKDMFIPLIIEFFVYLLLGLQVYIIALAFSINIPFHIFILIHTITVVAVGVIPLSIGGLGVREGTFVLLMTPFGVETYIAFVISFSGFIVKALVPSIIGMFLSFKEHLEK